MWKSLRDLPQRLCETSPSNLKQGGINRPRRDQSLKSPQFTQPPNLPKKTKAKSCASGFFHIFSDFTYWPPPPHHDHFTPNTTHLPRLPSGESEAPQASQDPFTSTKDRLRPRTFQISDLCTMIITVLKKKKLRKHLETIPLVWKTIDSKEKVNGTSFCRIQATNFPTPIFKKGSPSSASW